MRRGGCGAGGLAVVCLGKAREKVKEKEENILQPKRSVKRMEVIVAGEAKVKQEVEDEVVEEKAVGAGHWPRVLLGTRQSGAI